jgi:hypothetical protein
MERLVYIATFAAALGAEKPTDAEMARREKMKREG